jgi:hypothetical protein
MTMSGASQNPVAGYSLYRTHSDGYDIELRGQTIGRLSHGRWGWTAELLDQAAPKPLPFTKREHRFPMLVNAFVWLGNPPRKERAAIEGVGSASLIEPRRLASAARTILETERSRSGVSPSVTPRLAG